MPQLFSPSALIILDHSFDLGDLGRAELLALDKCGYHLRQRTAVSLLHESLPLGSVVFLLIQYGRYDGILIFENTVLTKLFNKRIGSGFLPAELLRALFYQFSGTDGFLLPDQLSKFVLCLRHLIHSHSSVYPS